MSGFIKDCDKCDNSGYIYITKDSGEIVARECDCYEYRQNIKRLKRSGLKDVIEKLTFDSYIAKSQWQKNIKQSAVNYSENPEGWFYIGGQVGSGKTHICTAICRELLLQGRCIIYFPWREESARIKTLVTELDYPDVVKPIKTVEILYIDDLFKGGTLNRLTGNVEPTEADKNLAFEILDYRYKNNLPTIISGEKVIDNLIAIDEGIGSRIKEMAQKNLINLSKDTNKNYRLN